MELELINQKIYTLRGVKVMMDRDLAALYEVETRVLKQAVKRNIERFPKDFLFVLNEAEIELLVSHFVIPSKSYFGGAKLFAFTEQGVAMLSSILNRVC
ncbi:MAG: ORF6N domain-containing protein [Flavobacteriales bacterium]|nr:ORF6N domain-containing protein [Flavobacteriales bacterium]